MTWHISCHGSVRDLALFGAPACWHCSSEVYDLAHILSWLCVGSSTVRGTLRGIVHLRSMTWHISCYGYMCFFQDWSVFACIYVINLNGGDWLLLISWNISMYLLWSWPVSMLSISMDGIDYCSHHETFWSNVPPLIGVTSWNISMYLLWSFTFITSWNS
jgi:hypothetical protein